MIRVEEGSSDNRGFISRTWYNFRLRLGELLIEPREDPNAFKSADMLSRAKILIGQNSPEEKKPVQV